MDIRTHETVRLRPPSPGHSSEKRSLAEDEFPTRNCLLSPAPTRRKQATQCGLSGMHCQLGHHSFAFSNQAAHEDTMNRPGEEPEETDSGPDTLCAEAPELFPIRLSTPPSALTELPQRSILALHCATAWPVRLLCVHGSGTAFFPLPAF